MSIDSSSIKVSVIIPNYNHARYLPVRLDSVLSQTCWNLEVILMDDCSPDNSREILTAYATRDARIHLVFNEQNSGSTFKQWNKGIALAKGEYIWIAESDDYAHPTFLARAIQKFASDPAIGLVYAASQAIDEHGKPLPLLDNFYDDLDQKLWQQDFVVEGRKLVTEFMSYRNIIPNASAVVIRRDVLLQVGSADENLRLNGDWVFWASILAQTKVAFIADKLNYFRFHLNNVRSKVEFNGIDINEMAKVVNAMQQYGKPNTIFLARSVDYLTRRWLDGIANTSISWQMHRKIYNNLKKVTPDFHSYFMKSFAKFMFRDNLSGARRLIIDGLVHKYFTNKSPT